MLSVKHPRRNPLKCIRCDICVCKNRMNLSCYFYTCGKYYIQWWIQPLPDGGGGGGGGRQSLSSGQKPIIWQDFC